MTFATDLALALDPESVGEIPGKSSPLALARYDQGMNWIDGDHIEMLNEALVWAATTPFARLIITMPPRHGKSTMTSRYLPAWYLSTYPNKRVIITSYDADLPATHGGFVRDLLERHGSTLSGISLKEDSKAKNSWDVAKHGGGMKTAGVGGGITGKGYDLGIVDDPVKDAEEANSKTIREKHKEWWRSTFYTRKEPGASIIVMMTRWHEDDLIGWLLKMGAEAGGPWQVLNLPAMAEAGDPLERETGAALWPERIPWTSLESDRIALGSYWWNAMYQQRPAAIEGSLFKSKDFMRYRVEYVVEKVAGVDTQIQHFILETDTGEKRWKATDCWRFGTCDPAASTKDSADYTVVSSFIVTPDNQLLVFDVDRQRAEGPAQVKMMRRAVDKNHLGDMGIEAVAYQLTLLQWARKESLPVREIRADRDKYSRALTAAARIEAHDVFFPHQASWLADFEDELLSFPTGAHDDQVDTLSYAAIRVAGGSVQDVEVLSGSLTAQ